MQTPYIWGNYTIIIMPPSFPEGGTPNPLLCYTSITTITGDKSQEYVLVRTAAAMYTAAQVTPSNWEDYWMNEGITTFIERHVQAKLWDVTYAATAAFAGNNSLATATAIIGAKNKTYVTLHPTLMGADPDYANTIVPYEKGFQFLQWIEDFWLGYYNMEDFIEYYIVMNSLASINAFTGFRKTFSNFVETYYPSASMVNSILSGTFATQWIYPTGIAPVVAQGLMDFNNTASWNAKQLALAYIAANGDPAQRPSNYLDYHTWFSFQ